MNFQLSKVIGHRGASGYAPENTLSAMRRAYELGARWVELDVMLTRCREAIIMHDNTLDRTTNGLGEVAETDYTTVAALDAGSWFAAEYQGEKVPTFKEVLTCLASLSLGVNIEIKPCNGFEELTTEIAMQQLKLYWPTNSLAPLISSFSSKVIETVRKLDAKIALGYVIDSWNCDWEYVLIKNRCLSLHVNHTIVDAKMIAAVKQAGHYVLCYTVNEPQRASELFQWGVDAVFTDYPDVILSATVSSA